MVACKVNSSKQAYVGERCVGEEREAFKQVLMVIVLDHRRPVGLKQKAACGSVSGQKTHQTYYRRIQINSADFRQCCIKVAET